jgi:hypothetical protein
MPIGLRSDFDAATLRRLARARIGQKNKITRRWAKRGSRPSEPHQLVAHVDDLIEPGPKQPPPPSRRLPSLVAASNHLLEYDQ